MNKKLIVSWGIFTVAAVVLTVLILTVKKPEEPPEYVFFYAENQTADYPTTLGALRFAELVEERTGATDANRFYKLNPYVADIPEKYSKDINGVKLLVMGTVDVGGSGCVCPEHVMLKSILSAMTYRKNDVVIMDMEAGLEHLGRGTAANMDQFIVVIEPGARSVQTYRNVKRLADDLGVKRVRVVANKVRDAQDEDFIRKSIPAADLLGCIHYNPDIIDADRQGKSPYDFSPAAIEEIRQIKAILDREEN